MKKWTIKLFVWLVCLATALAEVAEEECEQGSRVSTTLGQLCKTADFAAICSLVHAETNGVGQSVLVWKVERSVAGVPCTNKMIRMQAWIPAMTPKEDDEQYLVFGSHTLFRFSEGSMVNLSAFHWDGFREGPAIRTNEWQLVGGARGMIPIRAQVENGLPETVAMYWSHLRSPSRTLDNYYVFLKTLMKSNASRIRSDAKLDLGLLIRFGDVRILRRVVADDELDEDIRARAGNLLKLRESER